MAFMSADSLCMLNTCIGQFLVTGTACREPLQRCKQGCSYCWKRCAGQQFAGGRSAKTQWGLGAAQGRPEHSGSVVSEEAGATRSS